VEEHLLPVLNPQRLDELGRELESIDAALGFAHAFLGLLPTRVARIHSALTRRDTLAAADAILSLKTSSYMVGALGMAQHCEEMESSLRNGSIPDPAQAVLMFAAAERLREELLAVLSAQNPDLPAFRRETAAPALLQG
jgi:HPt (histidine-containing phosphotransfer) domain-containing protein